MIFDTGQESSVGWLAAFSSGIRSNGGIGSWAARANGGLVVVRSYRGAVFVLTLLLCSILFVAPAAAWLNLATYAVSGTGLFNDLAASVKFQRGQITDVGYSPDYLKVILTNTSPYDPDDPADILTAMFFSFNGGPGPSLTRQAAWIETPHTITYGGGTDPGGVVGGEWAFKAALAGAPQGASRGISSSGYGLFGPGDRFPGNNLSGPASPDGVQYGVTSAWDLTGNDNAGIQQPLIKYQVNFLLTGLGNNSNAYAFDKVGFQYGTGLNEPYLPGDPVPTIPEPTTLYALTVGLLGLGISAHRRRRRS